MSTTSSLRDHWCWLDAARIDTTRPDTARSHFTSSNYLAQPQQQLCVQRQKHWFEDEEKTLEATWKSNKNMLDAHNNHANHAAWVLIWKVVNAMTKGKRTTDQCKSKIKRLKDDYRKVKGSNKKVVLLLCPVHFIKIWIKFLVLELSSICLIIWEQEWKKKDWV